jgi:tetratricopeptide (TPR) repeat protein
VRLAAAVVVLLASSAQAESAWPQYRAAIRAYRAGEPDRARDLFSRVVRRHPRFTDAYYYLGSLADRRGDHVAAAGLYARVEPGRATYPLSQKRLGESALLRGDRHAAARHFASVVRAAPRVGARLRLAAVQLDLGRFEPARHSIESCRAAAKDRLAFRVLESRLLAGTGRFDEAVRACDRVLDKRPTGTDRVDALYLRAVCQLELQHPVAAARDLEQVLDLSPAHLGALRKLSETYRLRPETGARARVLHARLTRLEGSGGRRELPPSGVDH